MATSPEAATAAAQTVPASLAGPFRPGLAQRPCTLHDVGVLVDAIQDSHHGQLGAHREQRRRHKRASLGPPPRRYRFGRARFGEGGRTGTPPEDYARRGKRRSRVRRASL